MAQIILPDEVADLSSFIQYGIVRPDEVVLDTPQGTARHRRLRGSPRWSGQWRINLTDDRDKARIVESFLHRISFGYPTWFEIPRYSEVTISGAKQGTRADSGLWTMTSALSGAVEGCYITIQNRTYMVHSLSGNLLTFRLIPDIPLQGQQTINPFTGIRVYLSDDAPLYTSKQGIGVDGQAIFGEWIIPWQEYTE